MKLTLRTKFIFLSLILVTIIMITVTYFFTISEMEAKREAVASETQRIAHNIATLQLLDRQDWSVYQNYISQLIVLNSDIVYIAVYDDRNTLRAHALNLNLIDVGLSDPSRRMQAVIVRQLDQGAVAEESRDDLKYHEVDIRMGNRILGSVHVGFSLIQIHQEMRHKIQLNIGLGLFFLIVFSSASILVSGRLTKPLERLSAAMNEVAAANLEQRIRIETRDEIGQLAHNFNEMVEGLRERKIIENLGSELSGTFRFTDLANIVRERISSAIGASKARLYIKQRDHSEIFEEITVTEGDKQKYPPLEIDEKTREYLLEHMDGFMIHTAPEPVLRTLRHTESSESGLVLPMAVKEDLFGAMFFALPPGTENFSEQQKHFSAILAGQAALALENVILYEESRERERIRKELEIAREVQHKLLPASMPKIDGFQIDGICQSAREVGGDYFDFFRLDSHRLGIVVADVSGKGTSASFYMAEIKGMMLQLSPRESSPKKLLIEINQKLYEHLDRRMFVTMIYGILDYRSGRFTFCRAGHNALLHLNENGEHHFLTPRGIGLGLDPGELFAEKIEEKSLQLENHDILVFYTDGVTEAMNQRHEEFGEERLLDYFESKKSDEVTLQKEHLLIAVENFLNGQSPQDDMTLVIVKRIQSL